MHDSVQMVLRLHTAACTSSAGARIRFSPDKDWADNKGLDKVLAVLKPIKDARPNLTWADLIVLAGTVANEQAAGGAAKFPFCRGRSDAGDGRGHPAHLAPRSYSSDAIAVADNLRVAGLTVAEGVALAGRLRSPAHQKTLGYSGSWTSQPDRLNNEFFKVLLANTWEPHKSASGKAEFKAKGKDNVFITPADHVLLSEPYLAVVKQYAADNAKFLKDFAAAWTRRMNADRFSGPAGNMCSGGGAST
jgi:catalase (peroxidase I)